MKETRMKIVVDKMPKTVEDCLWAHRSLCGYVCYAAGNGEWSSQGCAIYYGGKCPYLKELAEEKKAEEAERVTVWQAAAEFGRSASDTWENANSATKTLADALYKPEEKDDD